VALHRHHLSRALGEERAGQPARPRPDLDHSQGAEVARRPGDPAGPVEVVGGGLAERPSRRQPVPGDARAGRRQADAPAVAAAARWLASRAARRRAWMRLVGSALPVPAMSSAVPWSGEVRTNGRPSVTLTVSAKASALTAISPWSWYMHSAAS